MVDSNLSVLEIVKKNANNEHWKEVIPLTAVLLERDTKELILYLIEECKKMGDARVIGKVSQESMVTSLLGSCLANEVQISPDLSEIAIEWYVKNNTTRWMKSHADVIINNKFGTLFNAKLKELFFENYDDKYFPQIAWSQGEVYILNHNSDNFYSKVLNSLDKKDSFDNWSSLMGLTIYFFALATESLKNNNSKDVLQILGKMHMLPDLDKPQFQGVYSWTVVWAKKAKLFPEKVDPSFTKNIITFWLQSDNHSATRFSAWALTLILMPLMSQEYIPKIPSIKRKVINKFEVPKNEFDKLAAIFLGHLIGKRFDFKKIVDAFKQDHGSDSNSPSYIAFANILQIDIDL